MVVVKAIGGGKKASGEVWENSEGLEWTVPSPALYPTFEIPSQVRLGLPGCSDVGHKT